METEKYNLFLDDIRTPKMASFVNHVSEYKNIYEELKWVVVRSYDEFVAHITKYGLPELISFDHDLGIEHIKFYFENGGHENPPNPDNAEFIEKTGKDCATWLVNYCIDNKLELPKYFVHSANPIGRMNIINYLENFIKNYKSVE
jgi:hypothetical protein